MRDFPAFSQAPNLPQGGFAGPFGQQGMFGGLPSLPQPQMGQPQMPGGGGIGFNPLMLLSPLGGLMAESPKHALPFLSPGIGIANLLGAFK